MRTTIYTLFTFFLLVLGGAANAADEGIEYKRIKPPVPTQAANGKVEVVEMFWYGCPHCFRLEPKLNKWLEKKPANVEFIRIPAIFSDRWAIHARLFYTAETLGVLDKLHSKIFDEIHVNHNKLDSKAKIRAFFLKHGVKAEDFDMTFDSFMINVKVNRARDYTQRYHLDGVPTIVVNGKYTTDGPMASSLNNRVSPHENMLKVVDTLIAKESK